MGFFWKFTRSGKWSNSYVSLIVDVCPSAYDMSHNQWTTSFEELGMVMLLLHDVEMLNQPTLGATKPAFKRVVESLGYEPTLNYIPQRHALGLVRGQCVMGRHSGDGLDWGYYASCQSPMRILTRDWRVACCVNACDGRIYGNEDKLACYRQDAAFECTGMYYDLMPVHQVMVPIIQAMKRFASNRTESFISKFLHWTIQR